MAEGWTRHLKADEIEAYSAGVSPHGLDPMALDVMREAGVDISNHRSKHVSELLNLKFDYIVTVCAGAHDSCPAFPGGGKVVHVGFDDPPALSKNAKNKEEAMTQYRRVRDEIKAFVSRLPDTLSRKQ